MRRIRFGVLFLSLLITLLILCGCVSSGHSIPTSSFDENEIINIQLGIETGSFIEPESFTNLEDLLEATDIVIVGTVESTLPMVELNRSDDDLFQNVPWEKFYIAPVMVRVDEVIWSDEADVCVGDTIRIDPVGAFSKDTLGAIEYVPTPEVGWCFLMFISYQESDDTSAYLTYEFSSRADGFINITAAELYPCDASEVFISGTTIDEVRMAINPEGAAIPDAMPDDFAIDFEYWIDPYQKNIMDTYNSSIQKDLILNGTHSGEFSCEKEDLEAIYAKMKELSIFELSGNMISETVKVTPNEIFIIRYRINGKEYILSGDGSTGQTGATSREENLQAFKEYLRGFMKGTPEYKAMPDSEGVYD